jgi:hypothetical protein
MDKTSSMSVSRSHLPWLVLILLIGLLTRIPHVVTYLASSTETAITYFPTLAASRYEQCATAILNGSPAGDAFAFASPLYILLLVPVYFLGMGSTAVFVAQTFMGITSALAVYLVAFKSGTPKVLSFSGALLWLLYAPAALYEMTLLPVALLALLISIWAIIELKQHAGRYQSILQGFVSGLIAGLRPPYILLGLFSLLNELRLKRFRIFCGMLIGLLVPLLVLSIFNFIQTRDFTPFSSSTGLNFVLGHAEGAAGFGPPVEEYGLVESQGEDICMVGARIAAENGYTTTAGASWFWFEKGVNWIIGNPSGELKLLITKFGFSLGFKPFDSYFDLQRDIEADTSLNHLIAPRFILVLYMVTGAVPFLIFDRKRWFLALPLLIATATSLCFFHSERYWIPAIPVTLASASAGLHSLIQNLKTARRQSIMAIVIAILLMMPGAIVPVPEVPEGQYLYNRAVKAYNMHNYIKALVLFEASAEASPPESNTYVQARMHVLQITEALDIESRI